LCNTKKNCSPVAIFFLAYDKPNKVKHQEILLSMDVVCN
jgi:hypothetical protein